MAKARADWHEKRGLAILQKCDRGMDKSTTVVAVNNIIIQMKS